MKKIAIIPARGGSKRIPRKNIRTFIDKPIIAYSIEAAINSGLFDEVMVSTDDAEIAEVAKAYGANVPFLRSAKTSDDHATTFDVIEEVTDKYAAGGNQFDFSCCIYPCAPFVSDALLIRAFEKLTHGNHDCVFPMVRYGHPIQRALRITESGVIEMYQPQYMQTRSQDLEPAYHDLGQFYFFKTAAIIREKRLWTGNTSAIELGEAEAHDIDTIEDWKMAELKYKLLNRV